MSFVFNTYSTTTPDLLNSVFYAHLVSVNPLGTEVNPSSLFISTGVGYTPKVITSSFVTINSETDAWYINTIDFSSLVYTSNITGIVIVKQVGSAININQDLNFLFLNLINEFNNPITLSPGSHRILSQGNNNPPALYVKASYEYLVGDYVGAPQYPDLNMIIITGANQRDAFVGSQPQANSASQAFYAPLNGVDFKNKGLYNDLIGVGTIVNTNVTIANNLTANFGYTSAAYFNGNANLSYNVPSSFALTSGVETLYMLCFYPTLNNINQILLDFRADDCLSGYTVRINSANRIELRTHTNAVIHTSTNSITLNVWNTLVVTYANNTVININLNQISTASGVTSGTIPNTLYLGGKNPNAVTVLPDSNFTGYIQFLTAWRGGSVLAGYTVNFPGQAPWNKNYAQYWNYNPITATTDITTPSVFAASTTYLTRSFHANTPPRISTTALGVIGNGASLNINAPLTNWFYDFGLGKAKIGELTFLFDNNGTRVGFINFASTNMVIQIWACNSLPNNTPSLSNLTNTSLWDIYNVPTTWGNTSGSLEISSNFSTSGLYNISKILTNITKYYRFYRIGFVNTTTGGGSGGSIINLKALQLTKSSIIYPAQYMLGPTSSHIP